MANDKEYEVPVAKNLAEGLKFGVTATGRQLGVLSARTHGLFKINYIDGRPGSLPDKLTGRYTGKKFAELDLVRFITDTWKLADELTPKKSKKPLTEVAA